MKMFCFCVLLLAALAFGLTRACNGYDFVMNNAKNCIDKPIIRVVNTSYTFSDNCEMLSSSCSQLQPYTSATIEVKVFKNLLVVANWKIDLCSKKPKSDLIRFAIGFLGVPFRCPVVNPKIHCYNNEKIVTFSEATKQVIGMFAKDKGGTNLTVHLVHDTGKSCFEFSNLVSEKIVKD